MRCECLHKSKAPEGFRLGTYLVGSVSCRNGRTGDLRGRYTNPGRITVKADEQGYLVVELKGSAKGQPEIQLIHPSVTNCGHHKQFAAGGVFDDETIWLTGVHCNWEKGERSLYAAYPYPHTDALLRREGDVVTTLSLHNLVFCPDPTTSTSE